MLVKARSIITGKVSLVPEEYLKFNRKFTPVDVEVSEEEEVVKSGKTNGTK